MVEVRLVGPNGEPDSVFFAVPIPDGGYGVLCSVEVVCSLAGVTPGRVRQLLRAGRFPNAFKIGRRWLIPQDDVDAYLAYPDRRRRDVPKQGALALEPDGE